MNKSLAMAIKDTKIKLASVCNESGLPLAILDLVVQGIYTEIHSLAEKQLAEEEMSFAKTIEDEDIKE